MSKTYFRVTGNGSTALVFAHGWLGNADWWDDQARAFSSKYTVVQMDHPGHGKSPKVKIESSKQYADAIVEVASQIKAQNIILVGHSMSGAYSLEAAPRIQNLKGIVVVDTLINLETHMTVEQAEQTFVGMVRKDFQDAVMNILPKFVFSQTAPKEVGERIQREFLSNQMETAASLLLPLYQMDVKALASKIDVPVIALNSEAPPTDVEVNKKYFKNYDVIFLKDTAHYPMLEDPKQFNDKLEEALKRF